MARKKSSGDTSDMSVGGFAPSVEEGPMDFSGLMGGEEDGGEEVTEESDDLLTLLRRVASGELSPEDAEAQVRKACSGSSSSSSSSEG